VYRPAAIEQLKTLAKQLEVECFDSNANQAPLDIATATLDFAKRGYYDVVIFDTAGRLGIDEAMMAEIKALHAFLNPIETLFVVDAMQGQDAINTAKAFGDTLPLTGIVLTKLDGTHAVVLHCRCVMSLVSLLNILASVKKWMVLSHFIRIVWRRVSLAWVMCSA